MQVFQSKQHASNEELGLLLSESLVLGQVVSQVTSSHQVNDKVQVLPIVEGIVHVDEERMVELAKELFFINHGVNTPLSDDPRLKHLLHRKKLLRFLLLDLPYLAKAATPYHIQKREVVLANLLDILLVLRFKLTITHFSKLIIKNNLLSVNNYNISGERARKRHGPARCV